MGAMGGRARRWSSAELGCPASLSDDGPLPPVPVLPIALTVCHLQVFQTLHSSLRELTVSLN